MRFEVAVDEGERCKHCPRPPSRRAATRDSSNWASEHVPAHGRGGRMSSSSPAEGGRLGRPTPAPRPPAPGRARGRHGWRRRLEETAETAGFIVSFSATQASSGWMTSPDGSFGWKNVLLAGIDSPASATSTICCTRCAPQQHGEPAGARGPAPPRPRPASCDVAHGRVASPRGGGRAPRGGGSSVERAQAPGPRGEQASAPASLRPRARPARARQGEGVGARRGRHRGDRRRRGVRLTRQRDRCAGELRPGLVERRPSDEDPVVRLHAQAGALDRA